METVADFRRLSVKKFCQVKAESKNQLSKTATMQYEQTVPNDVRINMRMLSSANGDNVAW